LLRYLVEMTAKGEGATLKSYSVAVDGLGRAPDGDPEIDTYARVQIGRLRKTLDAYYAGPGRAHSHRLKIEPGSYQVCLVPTTDNGEHETARRRYFSLSPRETWVKGAGAVAASLTALVISSYGLDKRAEAVEQWRTGDFPIVAVNSSSNSTTLAKPTEAIRQEVLQKLELHEGVRIAYDHPQSADYLVNISVTQDGTSNIVSLVVVHRSTNRMIWSGDSASLPENDPEGALETFLAKSTFRLAQPTGVIHANERRQNYSSDSPYGCWLRFTGDLQDNHMLGDTDVEDCAGEWYDAAPNHPGAAAIHGWTLVDGSIRTTSEQAHKAELSRAIEIMEQTRQINPDSPLLQISLMRAYSFANNRHAARRAGNDALSLSPENLDVMGAVAIFRIFQGEQGGEALLDEAIERHFNPPPWYYTGKFAAAMMQNDMVNAKIAYSHLSHVQKNEDALVALLSAALLARSGNLIDARDAWDGAGKIQPALRFAPTTYLDRLPLAPQIRTRLRQWLGPLLADASS